jgi:hypothetical protein
MKTFIVLIATTIAARGAMAAAEGVRHTPSRQLRRNSQRGAPADKGEQVPSDF